MMKQQFISYSLLLSAALPAFLQPVSARGGYDHHSYDRHSYDRPQYGSRPSRGGSNIQRAVDLFQESIQVRREYISIIDRVMNREMRPHHAITPIYSLADKLNIIGMRGDQLMKHLSQEDKRALGDILYRRHFIKSHQRAARGLERARENLRAVEYFNVEPFRQACRRFNKVAKRSYLGN